MWIKRDNAANQVYFMCIATFVVEGFLSALPASKKDVDGNHAIKPLFVFLNCLGPANL